MALLFVIVLTRASALTPSRPNIVYILADDLGYGDVQALNPERGRIPTPHLDRLAAQSKVFTDAHSGASICTPTRYGLMTGRYAWRTRLQQGVLDGGNDEPLIASERLTVATFLRQQGYATAAIGKWHLGFMADPPPAATKSRGLPVGAPIGAKILGGPVERGFDYFWGCSNARTLASLIENDRVVELLPPVEMAPRLRERAIAYLRERATPAKAGQPFFLYVALTSPHLPLVPSAEWKGKSPLGLYGDFVQQMDADVGSIVAALDESGLARNTLLIFASDNGCSVQADVEKLEAAGHFASARFRGYKADGWEGGHRVPFFVRWPGVVASGTTNDATIGIGDFMSTVADLLKAPLPEEASPDGVSFLPALYGKPLSSTRTALVHHSARGQFSLREGPWKLIFGGGSGGVGKPSDEEAKAAGLPEVQLYHLKSDPGETTNLASTQSERVRRMEALLHRYIADGRSTPGPVQRNDVEVRAPRPIVLPTAPSVGKEQ